MSDVIIKIQPSVARRLFGVVILCMAALVMLNFAIGGTAQSVVLRFVLFILGVAFLWQAQANFRFANAALILKREGLFDDRGELICSLSNISKVDRSWFSFKPSNGFLIRLHQPAVRRWSPGLYWQIGKYLGVGGSISPAQTKEMSDKLLLLMQEKVHNVELI
jgi:hypothetical protein